MTHHEKGQQKSLKLQSSKDLLELFKFTKVISFLELRRKLRFFKAIEDLKNKKHFIILSFCYSHRNSNNTPQICTQWLRKLYFDFSDLGGKLLSPLRFINLMTSSYDLQFLSVPCFWTALCCNQYLEFFFFRIVTLVLQLHLGVEYTLKGTMSKTCYIMSGLGDCEHIHEWVVAGQPLTAPPSCSFTVLCALAMMLQHKSRAARSIGPSLKSPKSWAKINILKNLKHHIKIFFLDSSDPFLVPFHSRVTFLYLCFPSKILDISSCLTAPK